jgi:hypothetical protein
MLFGHQHQTYLTKKTKIFIYGTTLTFSPFLTKQFLITRPAAHFSVVFGSIIAVKTKHRQTSVITQILFTDFLIVSLCF